MLSRPAGKSAGNSRLHVTVGSRVNDDFPAVPRVPMAGITIDTRITVTGTGLLVNLVIGLSLTTQGQLLLDILNKSYAIINRICTINVHYSHFSDKFLF